MASVITLPVTLKSVPSGYSAPSTSKLSAPSSLPVYPAGPSYISAARRHILQRSFAEDDKHVLSARSAAAEAEKSNGDGDLYPGLGEEEESPATLAQDPKEWKKQDHYAVLGLGNLRYLATDDQIKVARELLRSLLFISTNSRQIDERFCVTTRTRKPLPAEPTTMRSSSVSRRVGRHE